MNNSKLTENLKPIPNFTAYAVSRFGDVFRVKPAKRGRFRQLREPHRIEPVCHPRVTTWYVQLTSDSGSRHRVALELARELAVGNAEWPVDEQA